MSRWPNVRLFSTFSGGWIALYAVLLVFLVLFGCSSPNPSNDQPLAKAGAAKITQSQFIERLNELRFEKGFPDNGAVRDQLLQQMINEELLLQEARTRKFDRDTEGHREFELIRQKALVDEYAQHIIHPTVSISSGELEELFIRFNTTITARHLLAQSFAQANELRERLLNGESYEDLAREVFEDPTLRNNGGLLPVFTVDDTEPAFEEAAFTLPVGSISEPIKLKHGYSVMRVESRDRTPMMTRHQFSTKKGELESFLQRRKLRIAAARHTDWIRDEVLDVQVHSEASLRLWHELQGDHTSQPEASFSSSNSRRNSAVLETAGRSLDSRACRRLLATATPAQWDWVQDETQFEELLTGLLVRDYMVQQAEVFGFDLDAEFEHGLEQMQEQYLLGRMRDTLTATQPIPLDSLKAFYTAHLDRYNRPASILLRGIRLSSMDAARRLEEQFQNGLSFEQAAKEWSIDRESGERGGMLGLFTQSDLGPEVKAVWSLSEGEIHGPVKMPGGGVGFFQVAARRTASKPTYEEVADKVDADYRAILGDRLEQVFCKALREENSVVIYRDRLLNRNNGGEAR